jgi:hypothetical protein
MNSVEQNVNDMVALLDQLIQTATQLRNLSQQVISEEELLPLQKHQEDLLHQLEKIDQSLQKYYATEVAPAMHEKLHNKLIEFQALNQEYVNNLGSSHGLIQFELHRLKDEISPELPPFHAPRIGETKS